MTPGFRLAGSLAALLLALAVALPASAQTTRVPVAFPDGATRTTVSGRIEGRADADHVVRAVAGQTLAVTLHADSPMAYFNVLPPGSDEAVFIGSTSGNEYRGVVTRDGDYVVRVYLMAAGARRGESGNYTLGLELGSPSVAAFDQSYQLHGIGFRVTSPNHASGNTLRIETTGLAIDNTPVERAIPGPVTGAEVGDLDIDRSPEIYVYVAPAGSQGRMALVAFSANRGKSLSDISLPAIEDTPGAAEGFVGPEQMAVVESAFARRFRIQADGRTRQLQYRLTQGEAGWRLRHERTDEF